MKNFLIIFVIAVGFTAWEKEAGEGGTSVIEGQVYKIHPFQNSSTGAMDTLYYQLDSGKDVFIIYSDNETEVYDDKFETDYNGRYHFEYLRKGDYTLYTYADSIDVNNVNYDYPIFRHIKISSNNSVKNKEKEIRNKYD